MRVASNSYTDLLVGQLNVLTARQYTLQNQVSSGLRVQSAADDPAAMQNTLNYLGDQSAQTQYSSNISTLQDRGTVIYNVLQSLQTISSRVGELATLGSDDTKTQSTRDSYADEVNQLIAQAVQLVNTKDPATGQYLFGGTASGQAPFTTTTDGDGKITGVAYNGNNAVNQTEIASGVTVQVDVPGANTSGAGPRGLVTDSRAGADLFTHLIALRDHLTAGNTSAIGGADTDNLQKDDDNLLFQISNNGVVQNHLSAAATLATGNAQALNRMISNQSSADMVQTMVQLNQAQNSYQAALASGSKIMQLSLLNYLQ
jgi:flagellar hook-associated protein 3 FlgL